MVSWVFFFSTDVLFDLVPKGSPEALEIDGIKSNYEFLCSVFAVLTHCVVLWRPPFLRANRLGAIVGSSRAVSVSSRTALCPCGMCRFLTCVCLPAPAQVLGVYLQSQRVLVVRCFSRVG